MKQHPEILRLVRDNIRRLEPYSTARDEYRGELGILLDANENPFGHDGLNRYPARSLRDRVLARVSALTGFPPEQVFLGNGSDECIDLCYRIFCTPGVDNALVISPSYGMYRVAADINAVECRQVLLGPGFSLPAAELLAAADARSKLLFLCSPNNPTGNAFPEADLRRVIEGFGGAVVLDEAYAAFSPQGSLSRLIAEYPHLIVLQTLSKAYGMAGLRIGLALADPGLITIFNRVRYPYNIGTDTLRLAERLIDAQRAAAEVQTLLSERTALMERLAQMRCVEKVFPSDANFFLIRTPDPKRLYAHLLRQGIIVRDRSAAPGCEGTLRITVGTPEENAQLIQAFSEYDRLP